MIYRFALHCLALIALALSATTSQAQGQVSAEAWTAGMVDTLPGFFCTADQYFMQCFEVTEAECRSVTKAQTEACLDDIGPQLPALLDMPDDGRKWGSDVGRCAGIGYDLELADRKRNEARCNAPG